MQKKQVLVVLIALTLILTSPISMIQSPQAGGGTVAAQSTTQQSDKCDLIRSPFFISQKISQEICKISYSGVSDISQDATAAELHRNIYVNADYMSDDIERSTVEIVDESGRSKQLMLDQSLYSFIKCYNSGKAVADCRDSAYDALDNFTSALEKKLVVSQDTHAIQVVSQIERVRNQSSLSIADVYGAEHLRYYKQNVTLTNGTTIKTTQIYAAYTDIDFSQPQISQIYTYNFKNINDNRQTLIERLENSRDCQNYACQPRRATLNVLAPGSFSTVETEDTLNADAFRKTHKQIIQDYQTVQTNLNTILDTYVKAYDRGELKAKDVLSPFFLSKRLGSSAENIDKHLAAQLWAAQRGLNVRTQTSYTITYTNNSNSEKTVEAGLAVSDDSITSVQRNKTYNVTKIQGNVYLYPENSSEITLGDGDTFTINQIRVLGPDGETKNTTATAKLTDGADTPTTTSTKEFRKDMQKKVNQYTNRTKIINNYDNSGGILAGLGGDFNTADILPKLPTRSILIVFAAVVVVLAIVPRFLDAILDVLIPFR